MSSIKIGHFPKNKMLIELGLLESYPIKETFVFQNTFEKTNFERVLLKLRFPLKKIEF